MRTKRVFLHVFQRTPFHGAWNGTPEEGAFFLPWRWNPESTQPTRQEENNPMTAVEMIVAQAQQEAESTYQDGSYHVYGADAGDVIEK